MIKFSVIVPVGPGRQCEILESLKHVDFAKKDFEVLVEFGLNPSENRNRAIKRAKGKFLVFFDDDAMVAADYFRHAEKFLAAHPDIGIVGGPQLTPKSDGFFAKTSGYVMSSVFGAYVMASRYAKRKENLDADEYSLTSANCVVRRDVFKKIKPFDPRLYPGEDPELYARAKKAGFRLAYTPALVVFHKRRPSYRLFLRQFFRYGLVRMKKERINRTPLLMVNPVFFIPSLFFLYLVTLPFWLWLNCWFILPLVVYTVLALIFSFYESLKHSDVLAFFVLPFWFLSIHVTYGVGMLWGLLKG
ncbi:MAG: glycosyltransferase [Nanoarchaeota archaeon]|nr:glycosyltransferase [Nanoarchaeota archaeon]